jgi:hypothetical protein
MSLRPTDLDGVWRLMASRHLNLETGAKDQNWEDNEVTGKASGQGLQQIHQQLRMVRPNMFYQFQTEWIANLFSSRKPRI